MSYQTWHNYGYGICTDPLETTDVARIQALIRCAPKYERKVNKYLLEQEITEPGADDYLEMELDSCYGIASIMEQVILEAEEIQFTACDDFNNAKYLLYMPPYPWTMTPKERDLTEDAVRLILSKYASILTDEVLEIDYQSVENGG